MATSAWFLLVGGLLLAMGLTSDFLKRLPVTNAMVYLAAGVVIGPMALNLFHFNPLEQSALLERITEMVVLLSLFTAGMKMPVPVDMKRWRFSILLAVLGLAITVILVAGFGYYALGLPVGAALLLGGLLAPTDPVLATDVQVRHPGDRDRLRFGLTCEAGINDGTAYPVVMLSLGLLGLHELGGGFHWLGVDLLWATVGGVAIGVVAGTLVGWGVWALRRRNPEIRLMGDFVGLGLIGFVYGVSLLVDAGGFLAVFAAAIALRQTERRLLGRVSERFRLTDGSLQFKEQLERLSVVVLILIIGGTLFLNSWSWRAVGLAAFLFLVARPAGVIISALGTRTPARHRRMAAWFGVRGIGSLYYLMFAIQSGLPEDLALELIHLTLVVVTLSIVVHGVSVRPALLHYAGRADAVRPPKQRAAASPAQPPE
ncbi:cation:proton antiporter [Spiribacter halobius]|uniref:Sodium:proton antiporter n=1 Tax=Sediminicurvatus halobius TaxID=2182432 RepID=A0A2U2MWJ8_9GAMM|nr:cation:proton antiporter [Spiribacter halobius]PWG61231.1 sodium:proton antiporter [Spiribacter halobius]UEX79203.1 cation:proton antiporter [Spiribacter halobius]